MIVKSAEIVDLEAYRTQFSTPRANVSQNFYHVVEIFHAYMN